MHFVLVDVPPVPVPHVGSRVEGSGEPVVAHSDPVNKDDISFVLIKCIFGGH